ncbi:DUF459 domain-containing protein [Vagococcus intermedius]|uniref:GDSL-type esterase/lipase family protein n=1 Tax=Vagococcus intermedius TaxID=2991418 RepID=A0AAF0CV94_9ENTE|nr:GDSL-type esterase/lipase family protein [Vagococcus intermedius]WEG73506.1 GDSL-type esterase/lipase family protein [Vagococcus intermedius]WEG75588.1 GDSL-type esterase/lipase family protein [Vagococcus intermedius]
MTTLYLFGDSITAGYREGAITDALTKRVAVAFPELKIVNAGIPGDTTIDALKRIDQHVLRYEPSYVTVFFGANDVATYNHVSLETYLVNLREIIQWIGKDKVILLGTPYASQKIHGQDHRLEDIKRYSDGARAFAEMNDIPFIDMQTIMLEQSEPETLLQKDGLHFSSAGYELLAAQINVEVAKKVGK